MSNPLPLRPLLPLVAGLAAVFLPPAARADMIIFKDGFVLQGKVVREKKTIVDPASGQAVELNEGFFQIYDGARQVVFSISQLDRAIDDKEFAPDKGELRWGSPPIPFGSKPVPPILGVTDISAWDKDWNRTFRFNTMNAQAITLKQHLGLISPFYARADSVVDVRRDTQYAGSSCFLTKELGPDLVRSLLANHKDVKDDPKLSAEERFARKMKVPQFLAQAGWLGHAALDLDQMTKDFPDQKEAIAEARAGLKKLYELQTAQDLKRAYRAGNFKAFERLLETFTGDGVPAQTLAEVRAMKDDYKTASENVKLARKYLAELPKDVTPPLRDLFAEAAEAVLTELNPDNVGRLDSFLGQARQAERQKEDGKTPALAPVNLVALAMSGWVLGNTSAETKPDVAQKLWETRQMVLKYQATHDGPARRDVLDRYLANKSSVVALDELAQIISMLPPPEPEKDLDGVKEIKVGRRGPEYSVRVPREYSPGRAWPVLLVAHAGGGQTTRELLDLWAEQADLHGYILAAPKWTVEFDGSYNYKVEEQAGVIDTLRDLKRRFNVDSDRVFLHGIGSGGNLAFDLGLSHPDLFAGVIPISSLPGQYVWRYRRNAQYLPFYIVNGDRLPKNIFRDLFMDWVPGGYPLLYNQYIGRGIEWFPAETALAFDWMDRKERANPVAELGTIGREFLTVRSADNRFYWLSTDSVKSLHLNEDGKYNVNVLGAQLKGSIGKNQISVIAKGVNQVSVWLGRDRRGQYMVELDKPVTVYINGQAQVNVKVTPSIKFLMEDLYERGDRQRLYFARLDFDKL
jgi:hypothetical protein